MLVCDAEYCHAANRVARSLDLIVLNVDQTVLAAAAYPMSPAALKVADLISAAYDNMNIEKEHKKRSVSSEKLLDPGI